MPFIRLYYSTAPISEGCLLSTPRSTYVRQGVFYRGCSGGHMNSINNHDVLQHSTVIRVEAAKAMRH